MSRLLNVKVNLSSLDLMRNDCSSHFIRMMDEYEISADGAQWLSYNEAKTDSGAALLNRANRIICGYSMMMLV